MTDNEPEIRQEDILVLQDDQFQNDNVCIVTGVGTEIGRATAIAAAANNLMTVGFDVNEDEGKNTQRLAREMGGQMIFIRVDMAKDEEVEYGVMEATKLGAIKYLANIVCIQHFDSAEMHPMQEYDQMQRILVQAPLYLSKLTISHMKKSADRAGVIGNMAPTHNHNCIGNQPADNIPLFDLRALSQSISTEGGGKIRSFTVNAGLLKTPLSFDEKPVRNKQQGTESQEALQGNQSRTKDKILPIEVANFFIFGFSRFARYLVDIGLT